MEYFKRILATILLLAITLTLFAVCGKEEETAPQGEVSDMSGEQHFNIGDIMSNSSSSASSETVSTEPSGTTETPSTDETHEWSGEFIITEKKYEYKEKNFMLLNVTNDTGKNCNLTITGTFYDEAGEIVRIQQQTYRNHPTGWSNYFIFYPDMKFDTFTYEVSAEEYENLTPLDSMFSYNGDTLSDRVTVGWIPGVFWDSDPDDTPILSYRMTRSGTHLECETKIFGHVLFLDENGVEGPFVTVAVRPIKNAPGYLERIAALCDGVHDRYGLQVLFIAMQPRVDEPVSWDIRELMHSDAVILRGDYTPTDIMAVIGEGRIALSMRLHSLIFAACTATPTLGFDYDPKVASYLAMLDMPEIRSVAEMDVAEALDKVDILLRRRDEMSRTLRQRREEIRERALLTNRELEKLLAVGEERAN